VIDAARLEVIESVQVGPDSEHAPLQLLILQPLAGTAVSVTAVPCS
jgi:hypothetical protein